MGEARGAGIHRSKRFVEGRIGVADARHDVLGGKSCDVLERAFVLGGKRTLDDAAARGVLPVGEQIVGRIDQKRRILRTHVLLCEERTLQIDALDAGAHELVATHFVRLCDRCAGSTYILRRLGKRSGNPRGGAATNELCAGNINPLGITIGRCVVIETVDVRIHETRRDPASLAIDDLALRGFSLPCSKVTVNHW